MDFWVMYGSLLNKLRFICLALPIPPTSKVGIGAGAWRSRASEHISTQIDASTVKDHVTGVFRKFQPEASTPTCLHSSINDKSSERPYIAMSTSGEPSTSDLEQNFDSLQIPTTPVESSTAAESSTSNQNKYPIGQDPRLRYIKPYWWPYQTYVKERYVLHDL